MRTIHPPSPATIPAQRLTRCREALEPAVWQLVDRARDAGWSGLEAALASTLVLADLMEREGEDQAAASMARAS